jgi:hypothetical protein
MVRIESPPDLRYPGVPIRPSLSREWSAPRRQAGHGASIRDRLSNGRLERRLPEPTAAAIERTATEGILPVNDNERTPFMDPENPVLYDANPLNVANSNTILVIGLCLKGKTGVTGTPFRDEHLAGPWRTGWIVCVDLQPGRMNPYHGTTLVRPIRGSDGRPCIVRSGYSRKCT